MTFIDVIIGLVGTGLAIALLIVFERLHILEFAAAGLFAVIGLAAVFSARTKSVLDRQFGRGTGAMFGWFMIFLGLVFLVIAVVKIQEKK